MLNRLFSALLTALAPAALAEGPGPRAEDASGFSTVRLMPGYVLPGGGHMAGIEIRLAPGWKTYWRVPGEGGLAPRFDWSGSANLSEIAVHFPEPKVFEDYGMQSFGYEDRVVFPVELSAVEDGAVALHLRLSYGICEEICIPAEAEVALSVGGGSGMDVEADALERWLATRPINAAASGLRVAECRLDRDGAQRHRLTAHLVFDGPAPVAPVPVVELPTEAAWVSMATYSAGSAPGQARIEAEIGSFDDGPLALDLSALRLTLLGAAPSVEIRGCRPG